LRIEHPNIVKYHRFVHTDDALYTVMERCLGLDLVDQVKEEGEHLPILRIRSLSKQILAAVYAVHNLGIMHRDIKPENFRFKDMTAQVLQLLDFGFAKPAPDVASTHSVTGTLLYAAPEVFDGVYCRKCDLWSTGVVLFQLFTGHPPFQTSDVQILRSLHRDPVLTGDSMFRGVARRQMPTVARSFMRGLLTVEPADRLSAEEAVQHEWLLSEGESSGPEESAEGTVSPSMRKRNSTLRRDSSQISIKGEAADLKRSYFVWDLASAAACGGDDDETAENTTCGGYL
jgi:calcium-dependent protein kinase